MEVKILKLEEINLFGVRLKNLEGTQDLKVNAPNQQNIALEGKKLNECHVCSTTYSSKYVLKKHILTVHEGKRLVKCDVCNTSYSSNYRSRVINRRGF